MSKTQQKKFTLRQRLLLYYRPLKTTRVRYIKRISISIQYINANLEPARGANHKQVIHSADSFLDDEYNTNKEPEDDDEDY